MRKNYIRTKTVEMWLGDDGIVYAVVLPNSLVSQEDNKANTNHLPKVSDGKIHPLYIDIRNLLWADSISRKSAASDDIVKLVNAVAIIVGTLASRIIGNFVLNFVKPPYPIQVFTSQKDALEWLNQFVD